MNVTATYPSGRKVQYTYDNRDWVTGVQSLSGDANFATGITRFDVYGEVAIFVERRFSLPAEREKWIAESMGDMFPSPFSRIAFRQPLEGTPAVTEVDIEQLEGGLLVGVPVILNGRFVCALYLRFGQEQAVPPKGGGHNE